MVTHGYFWISLCRSQMAEIRQEPLTRSYSLSPKESRRTKIGFNSRQSMMKSLENRGQWPQFKGRVWANRMAFGALLLGLNYIARLSFWPIRIARILADGGKS